MIKMIKKNLEALEGTSLGYAETPKGIACGCDDCGECYGDIIRDKKELCCHYDCMVMTNVLVLGDSEIP
jgi:hypothetical protein